MDDYLRLGVRAALDAVAAIVPGRKIHAVGYCIGGTILSIAAAVLAAEGDQRLASVTLLAAQTDFSEPGELSVFITPSQIAMLEAMMDKSGVLESERMGGAFALLRSRDLLIRRPQPDLLLMLHTLAVMQYRFERKLKRHNVLSAMVMPSFRTRTKGG